MWESGILTIDGMNIVWNAKVFDEGSIFGASMKDVYQSWLLELMMIGSSIMTEDGTSNLKTKSLKKFLK